MITLAQHYEEKDIEINEVARLHSLPINALRGAVERLEESSLIVRKEDDKLALKISPKEITIWQVVECIARKESLRYRKRLSRKNYTSTVIMIRKADEALESIISSKLKQYKLSEWGEKASKTVYI